MITISWIKFFTWVIIGFVIVNTLFALLYTILGISNITEPTRYIYKDFLNAFFFSAQTITTVGYGAMAPKGILFGIISSIEALLGLLSFSFVTGLLYGRFSKPRSNIRFSNSIVLKKHNGVDCIMFRLMSRSKHAMILPKIEVTLILSEEDVNKKHVNNFYALDLERDSITYLPITWTIVHPINETSPLKEFNREELQKLNGEMLILTSYYDESFAQDVHQVYSYLLKDLKIDQQFIPAFYYDKGYTILDHNKLDKTEQSKPE